MSRDPRVTLEMLRCAVKRSEYGWASGDQQEQ